MQNIADLRAEEKRKRELRKAALEVIKAHAARVGDFAATRRASDAAFQM